MQRYCCKILLSKVIDLRIGILCLVAAKEIFFLILCVQWMHDRLHEKRRARNT